MRFKFMISCCMAFMLLALSSCSKSYEGSNDLMHMWFEVTGKVVDNDGIPISGIIVTAASSEAVTTDAEGVFTVRGGGLPAESAAVRFTDVDKDGVHYVSKTVMIDLVRYRDGGGWSHGYYRNRNDVVVRMTEDEDVSLPNDDAGTEPEEVQ